MFRWKNSDFNLDAIGKKLFNMIALYKKMSHRNPSPDLIIWWKWKMGLPCGSFLSTTEMAVKIQNGQFCMTDWR